MEHLFKLYKGLKIKYPSYEGIICGYSDNHFIMATKSTDGRTFKRIYSHVFILDEYRNSEWRYILEDEKNILKQHGHKSKFKKIIK